MNRAKTATPQVFHKNMHYDKYMDTICKIDKVAAKEYRRIRAIPKCAHKPIDIRRYKRTQRIYGRLQGQYFAVRPRSSEFKEMILAHRKEKQPRAKGL